jgi:ammonia channel protein AmtB
LIQGAVAERCAFTAYLTYTFMLTAFIYPTVVYWGWGSYGFMSAWTGKAPYLGGHGRDDSSSTHQVAPRFT